MKSTASFEIRVALIGYVSVGKTTILNALLRDKYSEVSMKRTTAGVNLFRLHFDSENKEQWMKDEPRSAESTLDEISKDNKSLRDSNKVQEKVFDIEVEETFFEMRENTKIVLVDIPGINEAGASNKYKNYVDENWHTFDCVVVAMDGRQGVNTEEQMELLRIAQRNCQHIRDVPVVVLMNKIDDTDDEEQQALVAEARSALEHVFNCPFSKSLLDDILAGKAQRFENVHMPPLLIPMSAIHAFIYRTASTLSFDVFQQKMDKTLIDKLGRDSFGRRWKKFEDHEKAEKAYEMIRDPEECKDGIEASNFNAFMTVLSFFVGGAKTQQWLIEQQIMAIAARMKPEEDFVSDIRALFDQCIQLGHSQEFARKAADDEFRKLFRNSVLQSHTLFNAKKKQLCDEGVKSSEWALNPRHLFDCECLSKPMDDLFSYAGFLRYADMLDQEKKTELLGLAKNLVVFQISSLLTIKGGQFISATLSHADWALVFGQMIRMTRTFCFDEVFGMAGMALETNFQEACFSIHQASVECSQCPTCARRLSVHSAPMPKSNGFVMKEARATHFCGTCKVHYIDAEAIGPGTTQIECAGGSPGHNHVATRQTKTDSFVCSYRHCPRKVTKVKAPRPQNPFATFSTIGSHSPTKPQDSAAQFAKSTPTHFPKQQGAETPFGQAASTPSLKRTATLCGQVGSTPATPPFAKPAPTPLSKQQPAATPFGQATSTAFPKQQGAATPFGQAASTSFAKQNGVATPFGQATSTFFPKHESAATPFGQATNASSFGLNKEKFNVSLADSPRDAKHFGHLIWRFGKLLKLLQVEDEDLPSSGLPLPSWFVDPTPLSGKKKKKSRGIGKGKHRV